jgi:hypothetical protein
MVMASFGGVSVEVEAWVCEGVEGTSPWRFSTMFCASISAKTG